jgi:hypothetical protein
VIGGPGRVLEGEQVPDAHVFRRGVAAQERRVELGERP